MRFLRRLPSVRAVVCLTVLACGGGGGGGTEPPVIPPAAILSISTQPSGAVSGTPFTTQPVIALLTASGAPATTSTATVTVALSTASAGTLTGTTSVTAVAGVARFENLAVSATGTYSLVFTSAGLISATSNAFSVSPLIGPPASLSFEPENTILQVGQSFVITPLVRDAGGNMLITPALTYEARSPAIANIDNRGLVTTTARGQAIIVARTAAAPILSDSLLVIVAPPTGTVLMSGLSTFAIRHDTTLTISVYVDMRSTGKRVASGLVDVAFDPAQFTYLASAAGSSFAPSVGENDAATGKLHIAFANPAGTGGTAEIVRLTFRTAPTVGLAGRFTLSTSEMSASDFTDLLPNMMQVSHPVVLR